MNSKQLRRGLFSALAGTAMIVWPVYALTGKGPVDACKEIVKAMDAGKVTLASAIAAAEAHSKGKAVAAVSEIDDGELEIEVFCLVGDKIMKVEVDGSGKAVEMEEAAKLPGDKVDYNPDKSRLKPVRGG